jgi:thiamine-monophosphate kinase
VGSPKPGHTQPLSEDETLERIRHIVGGGIGPWGLRDDAALIAVPGGGSVLVSVDSVVDGVHVDLAICSAADVGWKALMGALSDLAAMGARPLAALVALCVPPGDGTGIVTLGVMEGVAEASRLAGCPVEGGDVSSGPVLSVAVTVMGTLNGGGRGPVTRAGALPGDVVLVTGPCGGSAAGLRALRAQPLSASEPVAGTAYRRPVARLREGILARESGAHAMMDVSDGLALDLHRLADASAVGLLLSAVPVATGATEEDALGGGEDYELIVTMDELAADKFAARCVEEGLRPPIRLGVVTGDPAVRTLGDRELPRSGWQHPMG